MKPKMHKVLGAMSGTSTDGVDVVALEVDSSCSQMAFGGLVSLDFSAPFREQLLCLQRPGFRFDVSVDPLVELAKARRQLSLDYSNAAKQLMDQLNWSPSSVLAFGVHGQTIRHNPADGYTLQIIDPCLVSGLTGLRVVSDFRSADVAAGGQGAPLVPAFHQSWVRMQNSISEGRVTAVLNLGGFSNLTLLDDQCVIQAGGDCGPANSYLDWCAEHYFGKKYDDQGFLASQGVVHERLLSSLLGHPFLKSGWPASTGREDFNVDWLRSRISLFPDLTPENLMATLVEMAVQSVTRCLHGYHHGQLYACGGGVRNLAFIRRLRELLGEQWAIDVTDSIGLPAQAVEAAAFGWLAACHCFAKEGNCVQVTGASHPVVLGVSTIGGDRV